MGGLSRNFAPLSRLSDQTLISGLLPASLMLSLGFEEPGLLANTQRRTTWNRPRTVLTHAYRNDSGGRLIISRDAFECRIEAFVHGAKVIRCALRDRRLDGLGKRGRSSPLNLYKVSHEVANALPHRNFKSAELSVYSWDPAHRLPSQQLAAFVANPDRHMYPWRAFNPDRFFPLWKQAFESGLAPWQQRQPVKGFAHHYVQAARRLLGQLGYHRAEAVPGFYNAAVFFHKKEGFRFLEAGHKATFDMLEHRLAVLSTQLGTRLPVWQQSWVVALQNIPEAYLKMVPFYDFGGLHWINSPTNTDYCARLVVDLNGFEWPKPLERV